MPVRVGSKEHWQMIYPNTAEWNTISTPLSRDEFEAAMDLYYIDVRKY